jgi:hypothetical protein
MPAREFMGFSGNRTRRKGALSGWRPGAANHSTHYLQSNRLSNPYRNREDDRH